MAHFVKILCRECRTLETMPCDYDQGMPPCECSSGGYGPCKSAMCLRCVEELLKREKHA
jgi:hypothetical protein